MRLRLAALFGALAALLVLAPAALAATYTVGDPGDAPDATPGDGLCMTVTSTCTLRAAIQESNASVGTRDTINFSVAPSGIDALNSTTGAAIADPVTIDGGPNGVTVSFASAAAGPLLEVGSAASSTALRQITFTGGASGPTLSIGGANATLDGVGVDHSGGDGIAVNADNVQITGGASHDNAGDGIEIAAQGVVVTRVTLYGNGGKPIALASGANGGIQPPQNMRIGPRQADGSLPLSGSTTTGGNVELWSGNPFGPLAPVYLETFGVAPGSFSHNLSGDPMPGSTYAATLTSGGTSEFATVTVPSDIVSPDIARARAVSTTDVVVVPSEPLDPGSVQASDFGLTMAGKDRQITGISTAPDGTSVTLSSSGWKAGEAGYVSLAGAGAITDRAGNANVAATRLRVAAAPGDFFAPIAGGFKLTPSNMCLTHSRHCRRTGTTIRFVSTEDGKATLVVQRGDKRVGTRIYNAVEAGLNTLKFNGRLSGRKLRAGRYRVLLYVQDAVGNVTDQPPIALLTVRRVTK